MDLYINSTTKDVAWMAGAEDIVFVAAILSLTTLTLCFCCIFYGIYSNEAVLVPAPLRGTTVQSMPSSTMQIRANSRRHSNIEEYPMADLNPN